MTATVETLIRTLPPYRDEWVTISKRQQVEDIIGEILQAHEEFSPYYDNIALFFDADDTDKICSNIYGFLKRNIRYREETEEDQTTALPAGILTRGEGDCKHFASFAGGILDGLNRQGIKIPWVYRFASYRVLDKIPHHVFIVVNPGKDEIWIDPTPGAKERQPVWFVDKKIKSMPLRRNIAGLEDTDFANNVIDYSLAMGEDPGDENIPDDVTAAIRLLLYYGALDENGNFNETQLQDLSTQLSQQDYTEVWNAYKFLNDPARVGSFFGDVWNGIKKVTLAVPRNAFLAMVGLNIFGYATKIKRALSDPDGREKAKKKWESLGGSFKALENTANDGAKKKQVLKGSGTVGSAAAFAAAAAAIIAAFMPLIKSILDKIGPGAGDPYGDANPYPYGICADGYTPKLQDGSCPNAGLPDGTTIFNDPLGWIKQHPEIAAMAGLGIYLLMKKKSRVSGIPSIIIPAGIALAMYFFTKKKAADPAGGPPVVSDDEHKTFSDLSGVLESDPAWIDHIFPVDFYPTVEAELTAPQNPAEVYKNKGLPGAFMAVSDAWQNAMGFNEDTHQKLWKIFSDYILRLQKPQIGVAYGGGGGGCQSNETWTRTCRTLRNGDIEVTSCNNNTGQCGTYLILNN